MVETIRLVAGREITARIHSKAFFWTTGLLVVAISAGGAIVDLALGSSTATSVTLTPQTQPGQAIARANNKAVRVVRLENDAAARLRRRTRTPTRP